MGYIFLAGFDNPQVKLCYLYQSLLVLDLYLLQLMLKDVKYKPKIHVYGLSLFTNVPLGFVASFCVRTFHESKQ